MYRTFVILRHTFVEAIVQPIYPLLIVVGAAILILATLWRIPGDYQLRANSLDDRELRQVLDMRLMHIAGLVPSLILVWMQISVLAAVSVAISTRVSLVVNLPVVILLYIAGNLTRFLFPLSQGPLAQSGRMTKGLAYLLSLLLPYLATFDLKQQTVYSKIKLAGTAFVQDINAVPLADIWKYVGAAGLNAVAYSIFALSVGMLLFSTRELGGAEG